MAGSVNGSGPGSAIHGMRAAGQPARLSTVDDADTPFGQIAVAQALYEQFAKGKSGSYGIGPGASAPGPSPAPTPSPSASAAGATATPAVGPPDGQSVGIEQSMSGSAGRRGRCRRRQRRACRGRGAGQLRGAEPAAAGRGSRLEQDESPR